MDDIEIEFVNEDEKSILKDTVKVIPETITQWLQEFRQTHFKGREFTDHFWSICHLGMMLGVSVGFILGEEVLKDMRVKKPVSFEFYYSKPFNVKNHKLIYFDYDKI
jgi:hypothetical protein